MNEVLGAVLGIRLTLQGMQAVLNGVKTFGKELELTKSQIDLAQEGVRSLAYEAAFMAGALMKAGEDQTMRLTLEAVMHSGALALDQLRYIRQESEKGLFDKDELYKTVKLFDLSHASLSRFLPLTEEIAARSGKGLTETARYIAELAGGGTARLMGLLKPAGITVDQLKAAGLNIDAHYKTKDSAAKIIAALEAVTSQQSITGAIGGSFMAAYKGDLADIVDFLRSIGDGLIPTATPVLHFLGGMVKTITYLNDLTGGWASNVLLAVFAFNSISKILPLLAALVDAEKLAAFWGGIMTFANNPWGAIAAGLKTMIGFIRELANVEKIAAAWAAVLDALDGNWVALAAGAAVAAAVGVAWHFANSDKSAPDAPGSSGGTGKKSMRRSAYERMQYDRFAHGMGT